MPFIVEPATATGAGRGVAAPVLLGVEGLVAGYGGGDVLRGVDLAVPQRLDHLHRRAERCREVDAFGHHLRDVEATQRKDSVQRPGPGRLSSPKEILSAGIVLVPQNHSLFRNMTVRENVELGGFTLRDKALIRERRRR